METMNHSYLSKLRIISKIPEHGKLDTTHNDINIYYASTFNWVCRKIQGDSKHNAVKYLTILYREINTFSDQLMCNIANEQDVVKKHKKLTMLASLTEKIKESLNGIRNLTGTYKDYLKVVSLLECLEQDIIIPQYKILKDFLPDKYCTEIINNPLPSSLPLRVTTTPRLNQLKSGHEILSKSL